MISVIIDGNYFLHKTFAIFSNFENKQPGEILSDKNDQSMFMRKVITDFTYSLNQIPITGHAIFIKDSHSWRKSLDIKRAEYKGSRKGDERVNWGSFFDLLDEFGKLLESNGYVYSTAEGAEGDDLFWFWNKKLRELGHNVIICTGDKDSHQLAEYSNNLWTICWNANSKNNKIFCDSRWESEYLNKNEDDDDSSIFNLDFMISNEKEKIKMLIEGAKLEVVNKDKLIFEKILIGDKKDDVPSVFSYEKTPNKFYKLTEKKAISIYENFKKSEWGDMELKEIWNNKEFINWISGFVLRSLTYTDNESNRKEVGNNYLENAQLVWLSEEVIPEKVIKSMNDSYISSNLELKPILRDKIKLIGRSKWDKYEAPSAFNPFKSFR